jgi:hypothetical protein
LISFLLRFRHLRRLHSQWDFWGQALEFDHFLCSSIGVLELFGIRDKQASVDGRKREFLGSFLNNIPLSTFHVLEQHNTPHLSPKKKGKTISHERLFECFLDS